METTRLIIRTPKINDLDEILSICNSEYVLKFNAMPLISRENMRADIETETQSNNTFFVELKDNNTIIGAVFIEKDSLRYKVNSACLSYYLGEQYAGNGYMSEALMAVIKYLFCDVKVDVISARAFAENAQSIKLLKKLGFVQEGRLRNGVCGYGNIIHDDIIFSILKSDYAKVNKQ